MTSGLVGRSIIVGGTYKCLMSRSRFTQIQFTSFEVDHHIPKHGHSPRAPAAGISESPDNQPSKS